METRSAEIISTRATATTRTGLRGTGAVAGTVLASIKAGKANITRYA